MNQIFEYIWPVDDGPVAQRLVGGGRPVLPGVVDEVAVRAQRHVGHLFPGNYSFKRNKYCSK